jgi:O-antigen/teichoic acid export membrane protein
VNQETETPPEAVSAAAATTGRSVLRGGVWILVSRVLPPVASLLVSVVAARVLGPDGMGRLSLIVFVEASLVTLFTASFPFAITRFVGESLGRERPGAVRSLAAWAWKVEGMGAALGATTLVAIALLGAEPRGAWLFAAASCAFAVLHSVPSSILLGAQRFRDATIMGLVTSALYSALSIVVLLLGGGITGFLAVNAAVVALNLLGTWVLGHRALRRVAPAAAPADDLRAQATRYALLSSFSLLLMVVVDRRSEIFFLAWFSTDEHIALYSIAFSAMAVMVLLPNAVGTVIAPALATLYGAGEIDRVRSGYGRALRLSVLVSLPLTAFGLSVGPALLTLLYGSDYSGAGLVLLILVAVLPAIAVVQISLGLMGGLGLVWPPLSALLAAAVVDVVLSLALVPAFDSAGAAAANSAGQLTACLVVALQVRRLLGSVELQPAALLRAAVAAAAAGVAARVVVEVAGGNAGAIAGTAVGVAFFLVLAKSLRIMPRADASWLDGAVGNVLGGRLAAAVRACAPRPSSA